MNLKKTLVFTIILVALCMAVSVVSASLLEPIEIGDVTSYDLKMTDFDESTSQVDFTTTAKVDISDLSESDKELLEKAIKDDNTAFILNLTAGTSIKITISTFQGVDDAHIDGDILYVRHDSSYRSLSGNGLEMDDLDLKAISFNTTDGQLFTAEVK